MAKSNGSHIWRAVGQVILVVYVINALDVFFVVEWTFFSRFRCNAETNGRGGLRWLAEFFQDVGPTTGHPKHGNRV
jgi:hypothetical protein